MLRNVTAVWSDTYRNALLEKDPKRIAEAVRLAEESIQARLLEIAALDGGRNGREQADLNTALRDLVALKVRYRLA
jgi:hypothetical protein